jgi:pimeloyl-ACP methyl ester carboxylesterase
MVMSKCISIVLALLVIHGRSATQPTETFRVQRNLSKSKAIVFVRNVRFDEKDQLYHVRDFFENGQIQMDATYSSLNKQIKEDYQCNYRANTKEGRYREWYENGNLRYIGRFKHGLENGTCSEFSRNGHKETEAVWKEGMLNGTARFWTKEGNPPLVLKFKNGVNQAPRKVEYAYLVYTPKRYSDFPEQQWPMIIYLHGGSDRGTNLTNVYSSGVPDQIYRGREFPFIVVAPQCPALLRWSTDDWFGTFYEEVTAKYRVDKNRVYLTGVSLGGEGTWYLAAKYPDLFAAIAPISGFTSRTTLIDENLKSLVRLPIWAFHGELDLVVPVEETRRMIEQLKDQNPRLRFTIEPSVGHWIHWSVYPGDELYDWFLEYDKGTKR